MEDRALKRSHAVLDVQSRRLKAIKIERLLGLNQKAQVLRLLEIGTGAGIIAHYFATHPKLQCVVTAVDIVDQRVMREGFQFHMVHGTNLPFPGGTFEVVISNHVIEHVGGLGEQENHLREMRRVMASHGVGYLATPNRWALIEPHYRLPLLSWLPSSKRDIYMRSLGAGDHYDCNPLSAFMLEGLFKRTGFLFCKLGGAALQETIRLETHKELVLKLIAKVPTSIWDLMHPLMPTLVYRLSPKP